ncbi:MAG: homocysteine S-methyltransferase family protein [SAR202 cluster bacterium]|nr:homocysteine S-methyltransferase family protein [SAR202 cluster bacterium]MDP6514257.1 homocysteine S-methyltransferase family protein [SAR202 cluster bacterium]MDP6714658.1 homocysteine S-methyltransferase family protein [SAR202 cluster bacterium]
MAFHDVMERSARGELIILDGAIGTEIRRRGGDTGRSDLAVIHMLESPGLIREIHADYINAGADVITANTYDCNRHALILDRLDGDSAQYLTRMAVELAIDARNSSGVEGVLVAGSLGPLASDYDPNDVPPFETCLSDYREQVQVMVEAGVDFVLAETAAQERSARAGVVAASEAGLPVWASLLAGPDGTVASGASWGEAVETLVSAGAAAVLINCTMPDAITLSMNELGRQNQAPVGAYGQGALPAGHGWRFEPSMTPDEYAKHAQDWVDLGARIIGGCCATTPEHIRYLRSEVTLA